MARTTRKVIPVSAEGKRLIAHYLGEQSKLQRRINHLIEQSGSAFTREQAKRFTKYQTEIDRIDVVIASIRAGVWDTVVAGVRDESA